MRKTQKSQRDFRRYQKYRDQHGRQWGAMIEISTGEPTGPIEPLEPFGRVAQVLPPQKFFRLVPDKPYDLFIDYDAWVREDEESLREYRHREVEVGIQLHGSEYKAGKPSLEILQIIGRAPRSPQFAKACRAGNRWALGLTDKVPAWARELAAQAAAPTEAFPDADEDFADAEEDGAAPTSGQPTLADALAAERRRSAELEAKLKAASRPRSAVSARPRASGGKRPARPAAPARPSIKSEPEPAFAGAE